MRRYEGSAFHHILMDGIALQFAGIAVMVHTIGLIIAQGQGMVSHNRIIAGNARQDCLAAAAKAGHIMKGNTARNNERICFDSQPVNAYLVSPGRDPYAKEL